MPAPLELVTLPPDRDGVAARCVAGHGPDDDARFARGRLNAFTTVAIIDEGEVWADAGRRRFTLRAGEAMLVPPGFVRHRFSGTRRVRVLALDGSLAPASDGYARHLRWDATAERTYAALERALRAAPSARRRDTVAAACAELAAALATVSCIARAPRPMLGAVLVDAYAAFARVTPAPSCAEVAASCGYRLSSLSVLSARESGRHLREWREAALMDRARRAIEAGDRVNVVAAQIGYDPAAFARAFGRVHGVPPSRWRAGQAYPAPALPFDAMRRNFASHERTPHDENRRT